MTKAKTKAWTKFARTEAKRFNASAGRHLTWDDVEGQCAKVGDFFKRLPSDLRAAAAERLIGELLTWGPQNHYEALGVAVEALLSHREISLRIMAEETEDKAPVPPTRARRARCKR
jgi:hypothetical protein